MNNLCETTSDKNFDRSCSFLVVVFLIFTACDKSDTDNQDDGYDPDPGKGNSDYVFDDSVIRTFEVELANEDLQKIDADPTAEQYVPATVFYDGLEFTKAAFRYKGGFGSLYSCFENFWPEVIGRDCDKLNYKIKFSEYKDDKRFFGLKRINLHGMDKDYSRIREILAYRIFNESDVPASRAAYVKLVINGQPMGLYLTVEQVDGQFTRKRFDDGGGGNLYKEKWFDQTDPQEWVSSLKTNREENPDVSTMVEMATELSSVAEEQFESILGKWIDVDQFMRYMAVEQTIAHWDSTTAFYCDWGCGNHNYFFYEYTDRQQVALIAWDLDLTFANFGIPHVLTDQYSIPEWSDLNVECQPMEIGWGLSIAPTCNSIIRGIVSSLWDEYIAATENLLETVFNSSVIGPWIDQYSSLIKTTVAQDSRGPTVEQWESEVDNLRNSIEVLKKRAELAVGQQSR
ncbi:MAG: hypothetical protein GY847_15285 [Proteobacteria bacterium]|nr:hypothetical protein [Pseudomonadota bacterium]